jgi:2-dehydro-3-deoxy-D-arabinonate dehydratase
MKLAKCRLPSGEQRVAVVEDDGLLLLPHDDDAPASLSAILETESVRSTVRSLIERARQRLAFNAIELLPPIDQQEVWAAGVTYKRSRAARMEESEAAASCYDRVYISARPELFFKATPHRVAGHGQPLRIRRDATWNVPEPELTLVLNSQLTIVAYTVGNDMSSRDIEGENPLYLPQAKVYDGCCGLGPWIVLADAFDAARAAIDLLVQRDGKPVFRGNTNTDQMARTGEELAQWLHRDNSFPQGAFLLTGTGIVPDSDFTLEPGDVMEITIDGIGTLRNPVVRGNDECQ